METKNPAEPLRANYKKSDIAALCDEWIAKTKQRVDAVVLLPMELQSGALVEFETAMADFGDAIGPALLMSSVCPDAEVAAEAAACEEKVSHFAVETFTRKDLYEVIKQNPPKEGEAEKRLYEKTVESFEQNGLNLPEDKLAQVRKLKQELAVLEVKFSTNLNNDKTTIEFTEKELDGAQQEFLSRLQKTPDGKFVVTMKYPDFDGVMLNVKSGDVRRRMRLAFQNRGSPDENIALLEKAVVLRSQIAAISGYASWADYRTAKRLAKSSANVEKFIASIKPAAILRTKKDFEELLALKQKLEPGAFKLDWWDVAYLENQLKKTKYALDEDAVREYFPFDSVMAGMFSLFGGLFGIRFEKAANVKVWHPDVVVYCVVDESSNDALGYIYFDMFPRQGKYGHAAMNPVISGRVVNGKRNLPVAVIMANNNPPSNGKPSLLKHGEVETLFHEFGHGLHTVLTTAPYASLSSTNTDHDFVEAPSQTLERWPWDEKVIDLLSGHYSDSSQKMPQKMRDTIIALRDLDLGFTYASLLGRAEFDLKLHKAQGPVDSTALYDSVMLEYMGMAPQPGARVPSNFGHLMGGYDSGYYSYAWSRVYAIDCFAQFEKEGLFNSATGMRYRKWILEQGDMQDGDKLLEGFLGRPSNTDAFYRALGMAAKSG